MVAGQRFATGVLAVGASLLGFAASASAAEEHLVTTSADGYADGTLRHEVEVDAANGDTVTILPGVNPALTLPDGVNLGDFNGTLTIQGQGQDATTVFRPEGVEGRIFFFFTANVTVTITGMTIANGSANDAIEDGGAILGGSLVLNGVELVNNQAMNGQAGQSGSDGVNPGPGAPGIDGGDGGAISTDEFVTLIDSTVHDNQAGHGGPGGPGGDSTAGGVDGGQGGQGGAGGRGGGISVIGPGELTLIRSTVFQNEGGNGGRGGAGGVGGAGAGRGNGGTGGEGGAGGAVYAEVLNTGYSIENSTIWDNRAGWGGHGGLGPSGSATGGSGGNGGGIYAGTPLTTTQATIAENDAGGGVDGGAQGSGGGIYTAATPFGATTVRGSLLVDNQGPDGNPDNCGGPGPVTGSNSISFPAAGCGATFGTGDPLLGPLEDNGGPTLTMMIGPGGAAIESVPPGPDCLATDQRGVTRPQGTVCDAGAVERSPGDDTGGSAPVPSGPGSCAGKTATKTGTEASEVIKGTSKRDVIDGRGGNDTIRGFAGNDILCGGDGDDSLRGGRGNDRMFGQGDLDTCRGGRGRDTASCETKKTL